MRLLVLTILLISCGVKPSQSPSADMSTLSDIKRDIEGWVQPCSHFDIEYPCEHRKDGVYEDHVTILAGNMALSGATEFCEAVFAAQGDDGRIWRSPSQVGVKVGNSSSRDMFIGYLGCNAVAPDKDSLWRSYNYIIGHQDKICPDASDNRCDLSRPPNLPYHGALWLTFKRVFEHAGLKVPPKMEKASFGGDNILHSQVRESNIGFKLNLNALQILIARKVGRGSSTLDKAAKDLAELQDKNPFFVWLHEGASQRVVDLLVEKCPRERPPVADEWTWSRDQDKAEDQGRSMGYDCLFMFNLLGVK